MITWDPEKPTSDVVRPMDEWFWQSASEQVKTNYTSVIEYLDKNTNNKYMIDNNIQKGISAHNSKFYKL